MSKYEVKYVQEAVFTMVNGEKLILVICHIN